MGTALCYGIEAYPWAVQDLAIRELNDWEGTQICVLICRPGGYALADLWVHLLELPGHGRVLEDVRTAEAWEPVGSVEYACGWWGTESVSVCWRFRNRETLAECLVRLEDLERAALQAYTRRTEAIREAERKLSEGE